MNPQLILGALLLAIASYFYGHHAGFAERDQEMQAEIALKNEQVRQAEHKLTTLIVAAISNACDALKACCETGS